MQVLSEANSLNVPKDVIQRNIKKAMDPVTADYKELTYEAYGTYKSAGRRVCGVRAHEIICPRPWRACCAGIGGVGMIINCLSDNNNRATADVNMIVKKAGCTIASSGEQEPSRVGFFSQHEELRDQRPSSATAHRNDTTTTLLPGALSQVLLSSTLRGKEDLPYSKRSMRTPFLNSASKPTSMAMFLSRYTPRK